MAGLLVWVVSPAIATRPPNGDSKRQEQRQNQKLGLHHLRHGEERSKSASRTTHGASQWPPGSTCLGAPTAATTWAARPTSIRDTASIKLASTTPTLRSAVRW